MESGARWRLSIRLLLLLLLPEVLLVHPPTTHAATATKRLPEVPLSPSCLLMRHGVLGGRLDLLRVAVVGCLPGHGQWAAHVPPPHRRGSRATKLSACRGCAELFDDLCVPVPVEVSFRCGGTGGGILMRCTHNARETRTRASLTWSCTRDVSMSPSCSPLLSPAGSTQDSAQQAKMCRPRIVRLLFRGPDQSCLAVPSTSREKNMLAGGQNTRIYFDRPCAHQTKRKPSRDKPINLLLPRWRLLNNKLIPVFPPTEFCK